MIFGVNILMKLYLVHDFMLHGTILQQQAGECVQEKT